MLLGTRRYDGRPLRKHLMLAELRDAHFRRWLTLFRRSVEELCPPDVAALWLDRSVHLSRGGGGAAIGLRTMSR